MLMVWRAGSFFERDRGEILENFVSKFYKIYGFSNSLAEGDRGARGIGFLVYSVLYRLTIVGIWKEEDLELSLLGFDCICGSACSHDDAAAIFSLDA